jgi:poly(glycerol-phosphate) alpha-glucosyltransferase
MAVRTFTGVVLRRAACLHVFSERELEDVRQYGCRHPVCVIPNGVVLDQTPAEEKEVLRKEFRRRVGTDRVCLFLGRLDPIKGLDMLFEAWAAAGRYTEGWKLILAGPGSDAYVRELREHAERLRLTEQIVFLGPVYGEAKREAYLGADCFVLPSRSEGMPMAALEAMAHRLPILITEPCNLPGVHASGAGIQVPSSVDGLRGGLLNLLGLSTAESVRMAARATALLQNEYHWPAVARQLIEVYRWLREQGPVPATVRLG